MDIKRLRKFLATDKRIKFAYLFGSFAAGDTGPLSDVDIAVFLDEKLDLFKYRLKLIESVSRVLGTDNFDLVVLNNAPIVFKFEVMKKGVVLKDDRHKRIIFERIALLEYLDTSYIRNIERYYMKKKISKGVYFG